MLLAHAPAEVQEELLATPLQRFTRHTVTDPAAMRRLLADVRRQGFVIAVDHITDGATGVAVPVRDRRGMVVAALNIVVPSAEGRAPAQVAALLATARGISRAMGLRTTDADTVRH